MIKSACAPYPVEYRICDKVARWSFKGPPAHVASRLSRNLTVISSLSRQCVVASFIRTLWNGWPTTARMRFANGSRSVCACPFGCADYEERLEHYLLCPKPWSVFTSMGLQLERRNFQYMLMADKGMGDKDKIAVAIACYGIARTVQALKSDATCLDLQTLLKFHFNEGLGGSKARSSMIRGLRAQR